MLALWDRDDGLTFWRWEQETELQWSRLPIEAGVSNEAMFRSLWVKVANTSITRMLTNR